jgi:hypothetical protein
MYIKISRKNLLPVLAHQGIVSSKLRDLELIMAAITVRKKPKLEFKAEAPGEFAPADDAMASIEPEATQAPVLTKFDAGPVDGSSYMLAGICGLVALLIFIALLFVQYSESDFYKDAFSANGAYAAQSAPASSTAPAASTPAPSAAVQPAASAAPATPVESTPSADVGNAAVSNEAAK